MTANTVFHALFEGFALVVGNDFGDRKAGVCVCVGVGVFMGKGCRFVILMSGKAECEDSQQWVTLTTVKNRQLRAYVWMCVCGRERGMHLTLNIENLNSITGLSGNKSK